MIARPFLQNKLSLYHTVKQLDHKQLFLSNKSFNISLKPPSVKIIKGIWTLTAFLCVTLWQHFKALHICISSLIKKTNRPFPRNSHTALSLFGGQGFQEITFSDKCIYNSSKSYRLSLICCSPHCTPLTFSTNNLWFQVGRTDGKCSHGNIHQMLHVEWNNSKSCSSCNNCTWR